MSIDDKLSSPVQYERLHEVCVDVFKYGNFDRIDTELLELIMPIVNIVYYQSISQYDDRFYAREDLIQDTLLSIYSDMTLRWDKYIHIDNYYEYIKRIAYKSMINTVHVYHNNHMTCEYDPDSIYAKSTKSGIESYVESKIAVDTLKDDIYKVAIDLLSHRIGKSSRMMREMMYARYSLMDEKEVDKVSRLHSLRFSNKERKFYLSRVDYLYSVAKNYTLLHWGVDEGLTMNSKNIDSIVNRIRTGDYETLSLLYGDTIIPDIYAEFGEDILMRFIKLFGGTTITIPDSRSIGDTILGSTVYTLADGDRENLYTVSETYGLPYRTILRIFDKYLSDIKRKESYNAKNS